MTEHEYVAHTLATQSSATDDQTSAADDQTSATDDQIDALTAQVFRLTIEGNETIPATATRLDPLWHSRQAYQQQIATDSPTDTPHPPSPADIQAGSTRIFQSAIGASTPPSSGKKRHRSDVNLLKVLDNMDALIHKCNMRLSLSLPGHLKMVRADYKELCDSLGEMRRGGVEVQQRKEAIQRELKRLKALLDSSEVAHGSDPVVYDTSKRTSTYSSNLSF